MSIDALDVLAQIRAQAGPRTTQGLTDEQLDPFRRDPQLVRASTEALAAHRRLSGTWGEALTREESALVGSLQDDFVNFYAEHAVNPYVPLAARGPWIITSHGAVLHDSGGYGMLGLGHSPDAVISALSRPWVVANIMTPSFSHKRFARALLDEIGHTRDDTPYTKFLMMNSGSESVTVAARISDHNAFQLTSEGGRHEGRTIKFLALERGFHGRTGRPALASHSTQHTYRTHLASHRDADRLVTVPPNDIATLEAAFAQAEAEGVFFEMMLVEPVMGEGNPGVALDRVFYDRARELTRQMGTMLLVDSIQAGLRAHGVLSLVDYPAFTDAEPPDMETFSKAINAAQYPLSVLAMTEHAAARYARGVYGNTMTANPRACEVGVATLAAFDDALRDNITARGAELLDGLAGLKERFPEVVTRVQGTGLLLAAELDERIEVVGPQGLEGWCRRRGLGVIHGGHNALRFTPHFRITSAEIGLMLEVLAAAFEHARATFLAQPAAK